MEAPTLSNVYPSSSLRASNTQVPTISESDTEKPSWSNQISVARHGEQRRSNNKASRMLDVPIVHADTASEYERLNNGEGDGTMHEDGKHDHGLNLGRNISHSFNALMSQGSLKQRLCLKVTGIDKGKKAVLRPLTEVVRLPTVADEIGVCRERQAKERDNASLSNSTAGSSGAEGSGETSSDSNDELKNEDLVSSTKIGAGSGSTSRLAAEKQ
ncbi:hypothetical protein EW146_g7490 [Bondarzewia mesenterica]|uniref:Uncharacterized protein n=1 Tax=Bondarzewia mesenterica TaxID=1095465 RepID=A0A4S4LMI6_9AGAM|nr:hypothetical protein EW146_g7490 [Bondarzewia mesenterica]